jgi:hypothetical protein
LFVCFAMERSIHLQCVFVCLFVCFANEMESKEAIK